MLPNLTIWSYLALLGLYFIYKLLLRPYLKLLYYKRQGVPTMFFWSIIPYFYNLKVFKETKDFYYFYRQILNTKPNTKVIAENSGSNVLLILNDPDMVKEFLRRYEVYHKDKDLIGTIEHISPGNVALVEDAEWRLRRRQIANSFNFEFLKHTIPMIIDVVQNEFSGLIKNNQLSRVNINDHAVIMAGEVVGRFFFGKRFDKETLFGVPITIAVQKLFKDAMNEMFTLSTALTGNKLMHANILPRHRDLNHRIAELKKKSAEMIRDVEQSQNKDENLLNMLFEHRNNENAKVNDDHITSTFTSLFIAGAETISHLIGSTIYFLWRHPNVFARVKEEVDREFLDLSKVDIETLNRMDYLTVTLKEALRLGGPSASLFPRVAVKDDNLCGLKVKKGTQVNFYYNVINKDPRFFTDPESFIPERWLGDNTYSQDKGKLDPFCFVPFSSGPRNCVGQNLAMIEARIMISLFVRTFEFSFDERYEFLLVPQLTLDPISPLLANLKVRSN